jgi:hypothetical protein
MNFYSVKDLRLSSKDIWETLDKTGEAIITNNGKPAAIMVDISGEDIEVYLKAVRQAKAMLAFNAMRSKAADAGFLSEDEIQEEIDAYRLEKKIG